MYHQAELSQTLHISHGVCSYVQHDSRIKQQLFPCTALSDPYYGEVKCFLWGRDWILVGNFDQFYVFIGLFLFLEHILKNIKGQGHETEFEATGLVVVLCHPTADCYQHEDEVEATTTSHRQRRFS